MPDDDSSSPLEPYSTQFPAVDPWEKSDPTMTAGGSATTSPLPLSTSAAANAADKGAVDEAVSAPVPPEPARPARKARLPIMLVLTGVLAVGTLAVAVPLLGSSDDGKKDGQSTTQMTAADQSTSPMGAVTTPTSAASTSPRATASASTTPKTTRTDSKPADSKSPTTSASPARTGTLVNGGSGKCLTGGASHAAVKIQSCNASANQQWELRQDGTFRANGLCISLSGGATNSFARVTMATCDGTQSQQFHLNMTDDIYARHAKRCLDLYNKQVTDGTTIVLQPCVGEPNQSWYLK